MTQRGADADADRSTTGPPPVIARAAGPVVPPVVDPPTVEARLLEGSQTGVITCDERRVVRSANPAALRLLPGLAVGEVLPTGAAVLWTAGHGESVELEAGGRSLAARRQDLPDGWTGWHVEDVTEPRSRMDSLLAERARSRFLAEAGNRLKLSLHPGRTARTAAQLAARLTDAAVVVLPVAAGTVQWFRCDAGQVDSGRLRVRELPGPVAAALDGLAVPPAPLLPAELRGEPWAPQAPTAGAVVTALPGNGKPAGALVLLRRTDRPGDTGPDQALVHEFAQHAGIALAAAGLYAQQARTAGVLKRSLLEPRLPEIEGITLGAAYRPADEGLLIGGDFYDVHPARPTDPDGTMLLLGDVCGKGVDAAVSTGQLRQSVRALRRVEPDPVRLLELLNATMLEAVPDDADPRFVTLVLGSARPLPGGGLRLVLAGGGHPAPLLVRRGGVEAVEIGGTLVGGMRRARFRSRTVDLAPGEACVLYTDGVTEARGGDDGTQLFGEERLAELLTGCHVLPAPGIAERVTQHTDRWLTTDNHDDIAVLVVQAPLPVNPATGRRHLHSVAASATPTTGLEEEPA
ncbi:SpoIIE family protein phosphatase [Pseudonocardia humida]|uniref:SpoIIE family protein phosphatase n=1 Tax=Pseudonocardia humida TaxID=2800819 RepID=A0ABT0ZTN1_9PSEU|nr:SpoIIE family protein phosphatase [Pseudonocardia humida]MCO1654048.1 SpoIIE family protein phosphatase [Pseudonocardia humida]